MEFFSRQTRFKRSNTLSPSSIPTSSAGRSTPSAGTRSAFSTFSQSGCSKIDAQEMETVQTDAAFSCAPFCSLCASDGSVFGLPASSGSGCTEGRDSSVSALSEETDSPCAPFVCPACSCTALEADVSFRSGSGGNSAGFTLQAATVNAVITASRTLPARLMCLISISSLPYCFAAPGWDNRPGAASFQIMRQPALQAPPCGRGSSHRVRRGQTKQVRRPPARWP